MRFFRSDRGFVARLAVLYAALFLVIGIQMPFLPVWLKAKGLDAQMIGVVLAAPMVARIFAIPFATRTADRRDAFRGGIMASTAASVLGYAIVGLAVGPLAILATFTLASFFTTLMLPLSEAYALKGLAARGRAYGPVRLWGSATFILGSFTAGIASDTIPARDLIWLIVAANVLATLAATGLAPLHVTPQPAPESAPPRSLLRDRSFVAVLVAASLIQASHAVFYGFSALQWRGEGLDGTAVAALWGLGVIAEMVLFALQGRLSLPPQMLLVAGAIGATLRWSAMAFNPPVALLPFLQVLHAASFGATHLGTMGLVFAKAPPGHGATAQGYVAVALGTTMAGASVLSGLLYGSFGSLAYAAMALAAIAGGAAAGVAIRASRQVAVV